METYHKVGQELTAKQRGMYFRIGAEIESTRRTRHGFNYDANICHADALAALHETGWKSLKAARSFLTAINGWDKSFTGGFN